MFTLTIRLQSDPQNTHRLNIAAFISHGLFHFEEILFVLINVIKVGQRLKPHVRDSVIPNLRECHEIMLVCLISCHMPRTSCVSLLNRFNCKCVSHVFHPLCTHSTEDCRRPAIKLNTATLKYINDSALDTSVKEDLGYCGYNI